MPNKDTYIHDRMDATELDPLCNQLFMKICIFIHDNIPFVGPFLMKCAIRGTI